MSILILRGRSIVLAALAAFVLVPSARAGERKTELHLLAVGVGKYQRPGNDLFWMDQNARDHDAFWKNQTGGLFARVHPRLLVNRDATAARIRLALRDLAQRVQDGDLVIASFSGHGTDPKKGEWRFCAYDDRILASEFHDWAKALAGKGARVVLVFDSCFSGKMTESRTPNVAVLASSRADQVSYDLDGVALRGNSLFTRVLFEGLGGQADLNGDTVITLAEVTTYLKDGVSKYARSRSIVQDAGLSQGGLSPDLPLVKLRRGT